MKLDKDFIKMLANRGRKSLFFLATAILGFDKVTKSIHRPICKSLEDLETTRRMLLMLPRDWYKTTLASICYPIWRAINNPNVRILLVQNSYTNATSKVASIKQIFEKNELFRACYPDLLPDRLDTWKKDSLCVRRNSAFPESTFEAAGTNTEVVSRHYDLIIEDDTVAPSFDHMTGEMMQPTRADVEKCIGWHKLAHPLLIEPGESQILVVGTRWVEDDLLEWIIKNEPSYKVVQRGVRENENGEPDEDGEIVWAETDDGKPKFNERVLKELEAALGPYMFSTLYLNKPTAAKDMLFKPSWINYYINLPTNLIYFTSIDLASAKKTSSTDPDYSTVVTCGVNPSNGHIYVAEYDRGRFTPGEHIDLIFEHFRRYNFSKLIVEAIGYQRTISYWLEKKQEKLGIFFPIEEVVSYNASKEMRIRGLQPYFANNRVFLLSQMVELENELVKFPYCKHDDLIDSLAAQLGSWNEVIDEAAKTTRYKRRYVEGSGAYIIDMIRKKQVLRGMDYLDGIGRLQTTNRPVFFAKGNVCPWGVQKTRSRVI